MRGDQVFLHGAQSVGKLDRFSGDRLQARAQRRVRILRIFPHLPGDFLVDAGNIVTLLGDLALQHRPLRVHRVEHHRIHQEQDDGGSGREQRDALAQAQGVDAATQLEKGLLHGRSAPATDCRLNSTYGACTAAAPPFGASIACSI